MTVSFGVFLVLLVFIFSLYLQTGTQTEFFKRRIVMVEMHRKTLQVYLAVLNNVEGVYHSIYSLVSAWRGEKKLQFSTFLSVTVIYM